MVSEDKRLSPEERYRLIGKLIEEIKLRRYSYQTGKSYISIVKDFLASGKRQENFYYYIPLKANQQRGLYSLL